MLTQKSHKFKLGELFHLFGRLGLRVITHGQTVVVYVVIFLHEIHSQQLYTAVSKFGWMIFERIYVTWHVQVDLGNRREPVQVNDERFQVRDLNESNLINNEEENLSFPVTSRNSFSLK